MNKKAGLFLSAIVIVVALAVGITIGMKYNSNSDEIYSLEQENSQLKEKISQLESQDYNSMDETAVNRLNEKITELCIRLDGKVKLNPSVPYDSLECYIKTSDAGKACTDSSQCKEGCEVENLNSTSGECYPETPIDQECHYFISNGKVSGVCS